MDSDRRRPDHDLVARLRDGDEVALGELVVDWTPAMIRLARSYVPSLEVAEEVVQDAWVAVVTTLDAFEERSSLRTWVHGIVVRRAQQTGVRERRSLPFSSVWRSEHGPTLDGSLFRPAGSPGTGGWVEPPARWDSLSPFSDDGGGSLVAVVEAAIARLPRGQAQVMTARDVWGCESAEVCELLSITPNHQRVLLHRARATVRASVAAQLDGVDRPAPRPPTELRETP